MIFYFKLIFIFFDRLKIVLKLNICLMKFMKCFFLVTKEHSLIFLTLEVVRTKQVGDVLNAIANNQSPTSI